MIQLHESCVSCAILLTALLLSACEWRTGGVVAGAAAPNLTAILEVPTSLPSGEIVRLRFTLTNNSDVDLYVLKWFTPLEGLGGEIFCVERDGQPIPYEGPLAARGDPTPDAYVFLEAGASVSVMVDLAAAYDFSEPGEYTITFLSPRSSHVARTEDQMAASVDELGPVAMPSNQVSVTISNDLALGAVEIARHVPRAVGAPIRKSGRRNLSLAGAVLRKTKPVLAIAIALIMLQR